MKLTKFIVLDSFSIKNFHETFNSSFLLALIDQDREIVYNASSCSISSLKKLILKKNLSHKIDKVKFVNLYLSKGKTSISILLRYLLGTLLNTKKLFVSSKNDVIIYTIFNPFFIWVLNFFLFFLKRNVYIICHGELELVLMNPPFYKPSFLYKYLINFFLKFVRLNKQISLVLLGDNIKSNFKYIYPKLESGQLKVIEHPYIFDENIDLEKKRSTNKLTLGTVGAVSHEKGFDKLVELSNLIDTQQNKLNVVGSYNFKVSPYTNINFISKDGGQLSTDVYINEINKLDFVLFFFDKTSYKLTVSGAIFDALNLNRPIIALKNSYLERIFLKHGSIGYLCEDLVEMSNVIKNLNHRENYEEELTLFIENIKKIKVSHDYKSISNQLNKIFK